MSWPGKQHPVETLLEWVAPIPLALAVGWAARALGLSTVAAVAMVIAALTIGVAAMRRFGTSEALSCYDFEPAALDGVEEPLDELLLLPEDEVLVLDDPLVDVAEDSRVVRLFARQEPTPGELVERIADFLGDGRRPAPASAAVPTDASAALHAALANIRASLR